MAIPRRAALAWRLGKADGSAITSQPLPILKPGAVVELSWLWDPPPSDASEGWVVVLAQADDGGAVREIDESNNQRRLVARTVALWVPRVSGIRCPDAHRIVIEVLAPNAVPTELTVETADTIKGAMSWHAATAATITRTGPTAFEAILPRPDDSRFFRVRLTPR